MLSLSQLSSLLLLPFWCTLIYVSCIRVIAYPHCDGPFAFSKVRPAYSHLDSIVVYECMLSINLLRVKCHYLLACLVLILPLLMQPPKESYQLFQKRQTLVLSFHELGQPPDVNQISDLGSEFYLMLFLPSPRVTEQPVFRLLLYLLFVISLVKWE